ncbi:MAG: cysteine synthase A [Bdellovibrionia bacterium]
MITGNVWDAVGETPLIKIQSLSELTGCEIYGKSEFLNPGGSIKDRAAKGIIQQAEKDGRLKSGSVIVEGTAGNTGIGLATLAASRGYKVIISIPDNQAAEKYEVLKALGAELHLVKPCPFSDQNHFYHTARRIAESTPNGFWANQFENPANSRFHYVTTGPEVWNQLSGKIDILTLATGTGGTIGGVSSFLKEKNPKIRVVLADPMGSGMATFLKTGEIKSEGSSVTEGIGIMRLTANFKTAKIDDAIQVDDLKMISMLYHLAKEDGLLLGTSSALNLFSAFQLGMAERGSKKKIVTFLCDSATRYASRVFNTTWLNEKSLQPRALTSFLS